MKLRSCTLEYDENMRVLLTLLSGDEPAVTVMLPENPDNPMYEPKDETLRSMALDQEATEILETQPEQHSRVGKLEGNGAITEEYTREARVIQKARETLKLNYGTGSLSGLKRTP